MGNDLKLTSQRFGDLVILKSLGGGSQGEVFKVSSSNGDYALKWFNQTWAGSAHFRNEIAHLVDTGPPDVPKGVGKRFLWPTDVVTNSSGGFGYLMDIMPDGFHDWSKLSNKKYRKRKQLRQPDLSAMCKVSFYTAHSFRSLHLKGYCYRDVSDNNIMADPLTGEILICDNDNVTSSNTSGSQLEIRGTLDFMAPEVILEKSPPNATSDLHSLAVLLFHIWMGDHPMKGLAFTKYKGVIADPEKIELYGVNPVFIFDPDDQSNKLPESFNVSVASRWELCPEAIKQLFIRAFTHGLKNPDRRVTEGEWRSAFLKIKAGASKCKSCGKEILIDLEDDKQRCWNCNVELTKPPRLCFFGNAFKHEIPLVQSTKINPHHLWPRGKRKFRKN